MKIRLFAFVFATVLFAAFNVAAQRNVEPVIDRDPLMEADAKHNLDVAQQAFGPAKKAYKQVLLRFEETFAAYPDFSRMDEFLYIAGMSSYYLSENKGKQKVNLKIEAEKKKYDPEKLKNEATMYLTMILDKYPDSKYRGDAEEALKVIDPGK